MKGERPVLARQRAGHAENGRDTDAAGDQQVVIGGVRQLEVVTRGTNSVRSTVHDGDGEPGSGVSYFLPKRDIKVTSERRILKRAEIEKKIAAAEAKQKTAKEEAAAAKTDLETKVALLATLAAGTDAWKDAEASRATANGKLILANAAKDKADGAVDVAKAELLAIPADAQCVASFETKVELLPAVPDHSQHFVANFAHNILRDDDGKLSLTADGLLSSSNVVAADRTGDILVELAGAIAGFGFRSGPKAMASDEVRTPQDDCDAPVKKFVYQFNPADHGALSNVNDELVASGFGVIKLELQGIKSTASHPPETINAIGRRGAIFYRSPLPITVIIRQQDRPVDAAVAMIPQLGPISYIPLRSSAFVKTVDDVTFSNGAITSWNASRPSEVLEVVRLPIKLLKAVISVPAEILSLKVNLSDKDKALAVSQQAQIASQEKLAALKACISGAESAGTNVEVCLPK